MSYGMESQNHSSDAMAELLRCCGDIRRLLSCILTATRNRNPGILAASSCETVLRTHFTAARERGSVITFGAAVTPLVSADPARIGLIIANNDGGALSVAPINTVSLTQGIRLDVGERRLELWHGMSGLLVQSAWFGISNVATVSVTMIELFCSESGQMPDGVTPM